MLDAYAKGDNNQGLEKNEMMSIGSDDHDDIQEEVAVSVAGDTDDSSEASVLKSFHAASTIHNPELTPPLATMKPIRPRKYIKYEAMAVGNWSSTELNGTKSQTYPEISYSESIFGSEDAFPTDAPTDRLVVLDNLPIDMTANRLLDAYGRCGPIAGLKIFRQRPELDPGRKSTDSKKKIRSPSSTRRKKWERPRSPVYAVILYEEVEGATKALADPLRIFGMVLDKHLIRSHRPRSITTLFLEDIPSTHHDVASIEYELSQVLHPDLYVCLDTRDGVDWTRSSRSAAVDPLNCVIQFPCFEAVYWAYWKLSLELELLREDENCSLQWMETPKDAMLYWTRQLNF
jgi:hypothetical protein